MKYQRTEKEMEKWRVATAFKILELERLRGTEKLVTHLKDKFDESFKKRFNSGR